MACSSRRFCMHWNSTRSGGVHDLNGERRAVLRSSLVLLFLIASSACGNLPKETPPGVKISATPTSTQAGSTSSTPAPGPSASETANPETKVSLMFTASAPETYQPNSSDSGMMVDQVFLDSVTVQQSTSLPPNVLAILRGSLPTPCHLLRVVSLLSTQPDQIVLKAYSLFKKGQICIQKVQPFEVAMPLTKPGVADTYHLSVNGKEYLTFAWPS